MNYYDCLEIETDLSELIGIKADECTELPCNYEFHIGNGKLYDDDDSISLFSPNCIYTRNGISNIIPIAKEYSLKNKN